MCSSDLPDKAPVRLPFSAADMCEQQLGVVPGGRPSEVMGEQAGRQRFGLLHRFFGPGQFSTISTASRARARKLAVFQIITIKGVVWYNIV